MILRDYQTDAITAFFDGVRAGSMSGIISAPTGSGKSAIMADICRTMLVEYPHTKILVCTHRYELISQDEKELKRYYPEAKTGIYSAGLKSRDTSERVVFCGIQSVANRGYEFGKVDLLIIDEAHKVSSTDGTSYAKFIQALKVVNPKLVILGLSASPYRLNSGLLYEGEDRLFDTLYYEIDVLRLINEGYLCQVISKGGVSKIELQDIGTVAGEYNQKELECAANNTALTRKAVDEMVKYGEDRKSWIVFCTGIDHADAVCKEITSRGVSCRVVSSEVDPDERTQILREFKSGLIRCLVNINVLTEGFNAPEIDMVVLLMATKSPAKFCQACGRGMRICEGKEDCLILDFGGNTSRLGTIDAIIPPAGRRAGNGSGQAPVRECPNCHTYNHISVMVCPSCGYQYPVPPPHKLEAYEGAVLSTQEEPKWAIVDGINYSRHIGRDGKKDTLRCDFMTDLQYKPISVWLCVEHTGYAKKRADMYIRAVGGKANTIEEALKECLRWADPARIKVQKDGKFWKVLSFDIPEDVKVTTFQDRINSILS